MYRHLSSVLTVFALTVVFSTPAFSARYQIDKDHSSINFAVKHMVISKVRGNFTKFSGHFDFDPKKEKGAVKVEIDARSINTNNKKRDKHLKSGDFLNVKKNRKITFVSTKVDDADDEEFEIEGNLTLNGVTKKVTLEVKRLGMVTAWGTRKAGFTATAKINRKDFNMNFNETLETGGLIVGDEVEITIEVEGNHKPKGKKKS